MIGLVTQLTVGEIGMLLARDGFPTHLARRIKQAADLGTLELWTRKRLVISDHPKISIHSFAEAPTRP